MAIYKIVAVIFYVYLGFYDIVRTTNLDTVEKYLQELYHFPSIDQCGSNAQIDNYEIFCHGTTAYM